MLQDAHRVVLWLLGGWISDRDFPGCGTELGCCCVAQALMQPSKQSVEEVKRVVSEARHKVQAATQPGINGTFNEEDFMDGDLVDDMH